MVVKVSVRQQNMEVAVLDFSKAYASSEVQGFFTNLVCEECLEGRTIGLKT